MQRNKLLIVEDEESLRETLRIGLGSLDLDIDFAENFNAGKSKLNATRPDIVLTDLKLPDGSGLDLITLARSMPNQPPILLMTAYGTTDMAVEAMKLGAYHYITKPFKIDELIVLIRRALEEKNLRLENDSLKKEAMKSFSIDSILGDSEPIKKVKELILRVTNNKSNVLITGESGTGKELIARAIHYSGPLKSRPFVTVNCGAIPETLMESEMFGHKRGSFTGAISDKDGLFQTADTGTIFLDEVGELPQTIQVKLLRILQDRSFRSVGGTENKKVDVRIISATNRNLEDMVAQGTFREDLYYRLNVINIHSPSLRERKEDIPLLLEHSLRKFSLGMGKKVLSLSAAAKAILMKYEYPGNIRELQNIMERAVALEGSAEVSIESLPPLLIKRSRQESQNLEKSKEAQIVHSENSSENPFASGPINLEDIVGAIEREYIQKALIKTNGAKKAAADLLGISFRSFRYRLTKYGMEGKED